MRRFLCVPLALIMLPTMAFADPFRPDVAFSVTITSVTPECRSCDPSKPLTASPWFMVGQTFELDARYDDDLRELFYRFTDFPAPNAFQHNGTPASATVYSFDQNARLTYFGTQWDSNVLNVLLSTGAFHARVWRYEPGAPGVRDVVTATMTPLPVPEPATAVLLALGAALVARWRTARASPRA